MRIIAGTHRRHRLIPPADDQTTRPITDRVKETLFNRIVSLGLLPPGRAEADGPARVLDIFSGTGSMGLECLSRGAEHCTFVDADRDAVKRLGQNLTDCGFTERAAVRHTSALSPIWVQMLDDASISLAFLDPPYAMAVDEKTRGPLHDLMGYLVPKLEEGGVIVYRTPRPGPDEPDAVYAEPIDGLDGPISFNYGSMTVHFYQNPI